MWLPKIYLDIWPNQIQGGKVKRCCKVCWKASKFLCLAADLLLEPIHKVIVAEDQGITNLERSGTLRYNKQKPSRSDKFQKVMDNFQTLAISTRDQQTDVGEKNQQPSKKQYKQSNKQKPLFIAKSSFSMTILFLPGKRFGWWQLDFVLWERTQKYTEKVNTTSERKSGYKEDISVKN